MTGVLTRQKASADRCYMISRFSLTPHLETDTPRNPSNANNGH